MDTYDAVSMDINRLITRRYSTSFGLSSTLFPKEMRTHIYAIYGLVRVADEIVDTYRGKDAPKLLDELEADCYRCMSGSYSANPVVHAFGLTARAYGFDQAVVRAFFASMRMDTKPFKNTQKNYDTYIYGSAEAVGLMCLYVFVDGDKKRYAALSAGARALGAAYQKINFLRDLAADSKELGRWYFPGSTFKTFNDHDKAVVTIDIEQELKKAREALSQLPRSSRRPVELSLQYYDKLLQKLKRTSTSELKQKRLRVNSAVKMGLYAKAKVAR